MIAKPTSLYKLSTYRKMVFANILSRSHLSAFDMLGLFTVLVYSVFWIAPSVFGETLRASYIILSLSFIFVSLLNDRLTASLRLKNILPLFLLCIVYLWGLFTHIYATYALGRIIEVGRVHWYMIEHMLPFFVASALLRSSPNNGKYILYVIVSCFTLSSLVGILQFARFGPAMQISSLYTYKAIDNWDSIGGGIRAVGLTFHPRILALQSTVCLGVFFALALRNNLSYRHLLPMLFFSASIIASQARQYLLPLFIIWTFIIITLIKRNPRKTFFVLFLCSLCLLIAFTFGTRRLAYMLQSTSLSTDASFTYRANNNWRQSTEIIRRFPITGIGPDQQIFLGQSKQGPDRWTDGKLMESAYRVFASMYGYPGAILLVCFLVSLLHVSILNAKRPSDTYSFCASIALIMLAISISAIGYVTNVFDDFISIPITMLFLALSNGQSYIYGFRSSLATPLETLK